MPNVPPGRPSVSADQESTGDAARIADRTGPFPYDLAFCLEVKGSVTMLSSTRFCRFEDIRLKVAGRAGPEGLMFQSVGLDEGMERMNFGIGEGPNRHQRYVLFSSDPAEGAMRRIETGIRDWENRNGYAVAEDHEGSDAAGDLPSKKAFFNLYLWTNPGGSFLFSRDPFGKTIQVVDKTDLRVLVQKGGRNVEPRFFELLGNALLSVPAYCRSFQFGIGEGDTVNWEMDWNPILDGLVDLVKHVYGRKMTLLDKETLASAKLVFRGHFVPNTNILVAVAEAGYLDPVPIRVSGLKGKIWIESIRREILLDMEGKRMLKDVFDISFGIARNATIFPVKCEKSRVRISLVDECLVGCPDTDSGILSALRKCPWGNGGL